MSNEENIAEGPNYMDAVIAMIADMRGENVADLYNRLYEADESIDNRIKAISSYMSYIRPSIAGPSDASNPDIVGITQHELIDKARAVIEREGLNLSDDPTPLYKMLGKSQAEVTEDGSFYGGYYYFPTKTIFVNPEGTNIPVVFVHELAHHFDYKTDIFLLLQSMAAGGDEKKQGMLTAESEVIAGWVSYMLAEDYGLRYEGSLANAMMTALMTDEKAFDRLYEGEFNKRIERVYTSLKGALERGAQEHEEAAAANA